MSNEKKEKENILDFVKEYEEASKDVAPEKKDKVKPDSTYLKDQTKNEGVSFKPKSKDQVIEEKDLQDNKKQEDKKPEDKKLDKANNSLSDNIKEKAEPKKSNIIDIEISTVSPNKINNKEIKPSKVKPNEVKPKPSNNLNKSEEEQSTGKNIKDSEKTKQKETTESEIKENIIDMKFTDIKEEKASKTKDFSTSDFLTLDDAEVIDEINKAEEDNKLNEDIVPPVEEEFTKKELKKLKKQKEKEEKEAKKLKEQEEKLKWSTYHNGFVLADNEKVVKEYNCLNLINPKGDGIITLTNKRLLCSTNELVETEIDNIKEIESKYKSKFSFFKTLMFLVLGGLAAACFMAAVNSVIDMNAIWPTMPSWFVYVLYGVGVVAGIFALAMIVTVNKKEFYIEFFIGSKASLVSYRGMKGKVKSRVIKVKPGKESKTIGHEIGAVILEIKDGKYNE